MKYKQILTTIAILLSFLPAQGQELLTVRETVFDHNANLDNFAFGADISWLSQQATRVESILVCSINILWGTARWPYGRDTG